MRSDADPGPRASSGWTRRRVIASGFLAAAVLGLGGWLARSTLGEPSGQCFQYAATAFAPVTGNPDALALRDVPDGVELLGSSITSGGAHVYDWRRGAERYSTVVRRSVDGTTWEYPDAPHCRPDPGA